MKWGTNVEVEGVVRHEVGVNDEQFGDDGVRDGLDDNDESD